MQVTARGRMMNSNWGSLFESRLPFSLTKVQPIAFTLLNSRFSVPFQSQRSKFIEKLTSVEEKIPELTENHTLESCFVVGHNFCFKPIACLDKELAWHSLEIVASISYIALNTKKINDKEIFTGILDRGLVERFDEAEACWIAKLRNLVKEGVIEKPKIPCSLVTITDKQIKIFKLRNVPEKEINNIPIAIKNINIITRNVLRCLYDIKLDSEWPYIEV